VHADGRTTGGVHVVLQQGGDRQPAIFREKPGGREEPKKKNEKEGGGVDRVREQPRPAASSIADEVLGRGRTG